MNNPINPIKTPIKSIRAKCIDCCCGQIKEVRLCPAKTCPLWGYRMGHRPTQADIKAITAELQKERLTAEKEGK